MGLGMRLGKDLHSFGPSERRLPSGADLVYGLDLKSRRDSLNRCLDDLCGGAVPQVESARCINDAVLRQLFIHNPVQMMSHGDGKYRRIMSTVRAGSCNRFILDALGSSRRGMVYTRWA